MSRCKKHIEHIKSGGWMRGLSDDALADIYAYYERNYREPQDEITRPAEDALQAEVKKLKTDLGIQKNLTRQACFEAKRAYAETEKWQKMFYDLVDKQASIATAPKVIICKDINVPANAPENVDTKESEVEDE